MPAINRLFTLLIVLGIAIGLVGFGLDLIPGSNPGISAPQLMIILAGLVISLIGWLLRSPSRRQKLAGISAQNILIGLVTIVVMVVVLELLLGVANIPLRYPPEIEQQVLTPLDYWMCDNLGCRYDYDVVQEQCADDRLVGVHCVINEAGFHDTDTFTSEAVSDFDGLKIMALGDSFTFGASAEDGFSWVETIESRMDNIILWNFGMPGTGNNQALKLLEAYAPQLEPDIVILGFYLNDFRDNTYPLDQFYRGSVDDKFAFIRQYLLSADGTATRITDKNHLLYRFRGVEPPANRMEELLGKTRLGSLLLNTLDTVRRVSTSIEDSQFQYQVDTTRALLQAMSDDIDAVGGEFLILLIPDSTDLDQRGRVYQTAIELFEDLNITYINPINILENRDYERPPGVHWLTSGHQAVGNMVSDCLQLFAESGTWQPCDGITIMD